MDFSKGFARRLLLLVLVTGCAHARPAPAPQPAPVRAPVPATTSSRQAQAPTPVLDPSEEITPEELARIPDPVPASSAPDRAPVDASETAPKAASSPSETPSAAPEGSAQVRTDSSLESPPAPRVSKGWTWHVQILATPDRALADRVGREASERLKATLRIDRERDLFKVRLGSFPSEADALPLKTQAVEMGYTGAFRVKIQARATDG